MPPAGRVVQLHFLCVSLKYLHFQLANLNRNWLNTILKFLGLKKKCLSGYILTPICSISWFTLFYLEKRKLRHTKKTAAVKTLDLLRAGGSSVLKLQLPLPSLSVGGSVSKLLLTASSYLNVKEHVHQLRASYMKCSASNKKSLLHTVCSTINDLYLLSSKRLSQSVP